jgi:hypothetical protein
MEPVVIIPFGYDSDRDRVIPICLPTTDDSDRPIAWGWFEAVARVQNPLRHLASTILRDEWRVSELTETALKTVWREHGENYGVSPSSRVYKQAQWSALDLQVGGSERDRRGLNVALEDLDEAIRDRVLVDPCDYGLRYGQEMDLAKVGALLRSKGLHDVEEMLRHARDGCTWKEIGSRMNCDPDVAQRRFRRWLQRAARILNLNE